jgi:hypothetical protein
MRGIALIGAVLLAGCAATGPAPMPTPPPAADACKAEVDRLNAQLAAEIAERQKITRAAHLREETLRRQLEAMKSIERGILEREDRMRTEAR